MIFSEEQLERYSRHFVLREIGELFVGKVLHFDGLTMQFRIVKIPESNPDCAVCGNRPTVLNLIDNKEEYEESVCSLITNLM